MNFQIVCDKERKKILARSILEALPDWFGIEEAREGFKEFEVLPTLWDERNPY